ncbi:T9SS type A sorting domain-containing protein [Balneolaceae bacterium YR4-1]|uniref:T9SS type A sorting domain-containing protein n=1 Tax=Halalkalibaculum roseum TaxID=2709311 RepID=A0A6M1SUV8_9BACT|nr:T9SS type A sorting domain-containing protein [Halalkalibaculum roseum]NGP75918.1 T9SS type A sorting domain-containing protein [Halalkalibaculum roseum]
MRQRERTISFAHIFFISISTVIGLLNPSIINAQTPTITASPSTLTVQPNEIITLTFGVDSPVDAYYFGTEVQFDPNIFEFIGEFDTGIMTGGITIADLLASNRVGASVSLTAPLSGPASGNLLALNFRVRQTATVGATDFTFLSAELNNSNGFLIEGLTPALLSIQVEEGVSDLKLTIPAINQLTEGGELSVSGEIYVNDITVNESLESSRISMWVGLNLTDTDPSGWSELSWTPMNFDSQLDSYHVYLENVGFGMSPGTYYIALRGQLDSQPFVYGGQSSSGGGIWDGVINRNAQLIINENPPFRYVLAGWDFDDETLLASLAVPSNEGIAFQLLGANEDGFSNGAAGRAANADGWQYTEGDEKYWLAVLSTQGFQNITVSSKQYGTSSSPRDFEMEASLDGLSWELISPDTIRVASSWNSAVVDNLALPTGYDDQPEIYIRWIRRGDLRVDGTVGITTGNNRIDDVYIYGENIAPYEVSVWPGDTDDNGLVDELDVLSLGQYWLSAGPLPIYSGISWSARNVEAWIPEEGTYADANGDGRVNYRDLLPVGLNFGETNALPKELNPLELQTPPIAELIIKRLKAGDRITISIQSEETVWLTGMSYRINLGNLDPAAWRLVEINTGGWGGEWFEEEKMLSFERVEQGYSRAYVTAVHKGKAYPKSTSVLAELVIEATRNWNQNPKIVLERMVLTNNKDRQNMNSALLVSEDGEKDDNTEPALPTRVRLQQNYPNPFNPETVINYSLPKDGEASMIIYDMLGREVVTLFNGPQKAGNYDLRFDGSNLSSGIYIYRLKAEGKVLTRMLTLIK